MTNQVTTVPAPDRLQDLVCPSCGSREFIAEQLTWNEQDYHANEDEWGDADNYQDDKVTRMRCDECGADVTQLVVDHDLYDVYFEHPLRRGKADDTGYIVPASGDGFGDLKVRGRNGWFKHYRTRVWSSRDGATAYVDIYSKRDSDVAAAEIYGPLDRVIDYYTGVLESLLTERARIRAAGGERS